MSDAAELQRDSLTGLPRLETAHARIDQLLGPFAGVDGAPHVHALLLGFRRLDTVNLAYGASAGDAALAEVSARLTQFAASELDGPWLAARAGGGTFLLVAQESCSRARWQLFAEQLMGIVARQISTTSGGLRLSPRVGLLRALAGESAESLLDRLGQGLDAATSQPGRRLAWVEGEVTKPGRSTAQLDADLLGAIDHDEIEIVFQPQFALADDALTGAEALARWHHPRFGRIGAGSLFAIAERTDHVGPLSRHIAGCALRAAAKWRSPLRLSLNVTPADLAAADFARDMLALVEENGFAPSRLTLEVTEQVLVHDIGLAARELAELAAAGIRVALDDFGAGFCNFRYLKLLPLHYLKLDRSMVDGVVDDPRDLAVLRAIVALAGALGLDVIAEGIESEAQRAVAAREGCAFYQGFLRSGPVEAAAFADMA